MKHEFPIIPEELTLASVEHRILRACKTIRALPDKERRFLHGGSLMNSIWREAIDEYRDAYGAEDVRIRFIPKPYDVSDCLVALGWCNVLSKKDFRLFWWKSFDNVSYRTIAARLGQSHTTIRRWYHDALYTVWPEAIGPFLRQQANDAGSTAFLESQNRGKKLVGGRVRHRG